MGCVRPMATSGLMLVLVGCMTPAEYAAREAPYWSRPGTSQEVFFAERKICVDEVESGLYHEDFSDPIFPTGAAARRLAAWDWAREAYLECMHAKGWQLAKGARIGPPGEIYYP